MTIPKERLDEILASDPHWSETYDERRKCMVITLLEGDWRPIRMLLAFLPELVRGYRVGVATEECARDAHGGA